jgi:hypothetical protein
MPTVTHAAFIAELYDAAAPADRCPHLAHDETGYQCRQLQGDEARLVCDHFSLQLWCLAGPERWLTEQEVKK